MQAFTADQLKNCTKEEMISIVLQMQQENALFAERIAVLTANKFGRKTEKLDHCEGQQSIFNEAETEADSSAAEPTIEEATAETISVVRRKAGTREQDMKGLPVRVEEHTLDDAQLTEIFGENGWKRLPDQIYTRLEYTPAIHEAVEHHVAVYASKKTDKIVKAEHPVELWGNSVATPSIVAAIMNGKYTNHKMRAITLDFKESHHGRTLPYKRTDPRVFHGTFSGGAVSGNGGKVPEECTSVLAVFGRSACHEGYRFGLEKAPSERRKLFALHCQCVAGSPELSVQFPWLGGLPYTLFEDPAPPVPGDRAGTGPSRLREADRRRAWLRSGANCPRHGDHLRHGHPGGRGAVHHGGGCSGWQRHHLVEGQNSHDFAAGKAM